MSETRGIMHPVGGGRQAPPRHRVHHLREQRLLVRGWIAGPSANLGVLDPPAPDRRVPPSAPWKGRMSYREIKVGSHGVTIVADMERKIVWVAATVGGRCREALGIRYGPIRDQHGRIVEGTPDMWRPAFWRYDFVRLHEYRPWWDWLGFIVARVERGYLNEGSTARYQKQDEHGPDVKAHIMAVEVTQYLAETYRNG